MIPQQSAIRNPQSALDVVSRPEIWLSFADVARLESCSADGRPLTPREVQVRIQSGQYTARESGQKADNGKPIREIALASLTPAGQARYLAEQRDLADGISEPLPMESQARPLPARRLHGAVVPTTPAGDVDIEAMLRAGQRVEAQRALMRRAAVAEYLAGVPKVPRRGGRTLIEAQIAVKFGVPVKTLQGWVRRWKMSGPAALVSQFGQNRGIHRAIPEPLQNAVRGTYLTQQRQTISQVYNNCVVPWCDAHGWRPQPSVSAVARFIRRDIFPSEELAFRHGRRTWEAKGMAVVRRDPADLAPNDLWCADHRQLDDEVMCTGGSITRLWLTAYIDVATADFVGWCLRETTPNGQSVAIALRAGILKRGVPKVILLDNGKEFVAKRFGGKESWCVTDPLAFAARVASPTAEEAKGQERWPANLPLAFSSEMGQMQLADLGIERVIHALPYRARSKPIEPIFNACFRAFENLLPGWVSNRPDRRPEMLKRAEKLSQLLYVDQFVEIFTQHMDEWSASHRCGDRKLTPNEAYARAESSLRRVEEARLDLLLIKTDEPRKIPQDGIAICGHRFMDEQLGLFIGESAYVSYDPDHLTHIVVRPMRYRGMKRLIVAEIPRAGWFEQSLANEIVNGTNKAARRHLQLVAVSNRQAILPEYVDPTGANRIAIENGADIQAAKAAAKDARQALTLEDEQVTDRGLIVRAQRADKAAEKVIHAAHKVAVKAVATDVFAQAQQESAWQNGA